MSDRANVLWWASIFLAVAFASFFLIQEKKIALMQCATVHSEATCHKYLD